MDKGDGPVNFKQTMQDETDHSCCKEADAISAQRGLECVAFGLDKKRAMDLS